VKSAEAHALGDQDLVEQIKQALRLAADKLGLRTMFVHRGI